MIKINRMMASYAVVQCMVPYVGNNEENKEISILRGKGVIGL